MLRSNAGVQSLVSRVGGQMACRVALIAASLVGSLSVASGSAVGQTFSYTGGERGYPVPAAGAGVHVVVVGAPGFGGPVFGGEGAVVSADTGPPKPGAPTT